jgi:hypothetical protein
VVVVHDVDGGVVKESRVGSATGGQTLVESLRDGSQ